MVEAVTAVARLTVALPPLINTVPISWPEVLSVQVCVVLLLKGSRSGAFGVNRISGYRQISVEVDIWVAGGYGAGMGSVSNC